MFFHKKKDHGPVPLEEVQKLTSSGMSEKDVIKKLKSRGYSYDEIEKAMMSAVKRGVEEPFTQPYQPQQERSEFPQFPEIGEFKPEEQALPAGLQDVTVAEDINPDILVEEIVEDVIEEKWQKFEERVKKIEGDFTNLGTQLRQLEQRKPTEQPAKDYDSRIGEMSDQIEDLQARVGGLEKAFKQFLPSLTKNIESLSGLIHEMKAKQGMVAQEM